MSTRYDRRLHLVVRLAKKAEFLAALRAAVPMQAVKDHFGSLDDMPRLSLTGNEPAQAIGASCAISLAERDVLAGLRDEMVAAGLTAWVYDPLLTPPAGVDVVGTVQGETPWRSGYTFDEVIAKLGLQRIVEAP